MDKKNFYTSLEEIFEVDGGTITGEENLSDSGLVDSLSMLGLISFLDKKYNIQMGPAEILKAGTINELYRIISKQKATTTENV